ncbi:MAG: zinc-ribbon domain-containing protein [Acetobacteraceae bacterium]
MRIACPSCSATYDVPDSLVPAGRIVRCARCGSEWTPQSHTLAPPVEADPPPDPPPPATNGSATHVVATARRSAMDRLAANPAPSFPSVRLRLAWAGSVVLLLLLAAAAYTWRGPIVEAWPASARAYAAFGLHPQPGPAK